MRTRPVLDSARITEHAAAKIAAYQRDLVDEVVAAVNSAAIVVIGMAQNPHCARARRALDATGLDHRYLRYGDYIRGWRKRLAIKMWSGWSTFPQVFVQGELIGGADELEHMIKDGTLRLRLDGRAA